MSLVNPEIAHSEPRTPAGGCSGLFSKLLDDGYYQRTRMKLIGFFLLPSGWIIVIAAVALLRPGTAQPAFMFAGIAVELLGLVFLIRSHRIAHGTGK